MMNIPVFLCVDNTFAPFAATTMVSILINTKEFIEFYVLSDCVEQEKQDKIVASCKDNAKNFSIKFIEINSAIQFEKMRKTTNISRTMYARFLIPEVEKTVKRAIYTDVDVCVVGDIKALWLEDISPYEIGAVPSQRGRINNNYEEYKEKYRLDKMHNVMMSGLLLIDCAAWREHNTGSRLLELASSRNLLDQETLNVYYDKNNYKHLDNKYCVIYKLLESCFNLAERKQLQTEQIIIHYPGAGIYKPWNNPNLKSADYFWNVAKRTEFYSYLEEEVMIKWGEQIKMEKKLFWEEVEKYEKIWIYGAGKIGKIVATNLLLGEKPYKIKGIVVTEKKNNDDDILGIQVMTLDDVVISADSLIIIATNENFQKVIKVNLANKGYKNIVCVPSAVLIDMENNDSWQIKKELEIFELKKQIQGLCTLLSYAVDITQIPPAKGELRDLQKSDLVLLKIFEAVCKKHDITYWLDYGTLLGAFRHKGFIPWDDDLDIGMPRKDYEKIYSILKGELVQFGLEVNVGVGFSVQIIRLIYKGSGIQLDIWPYDNISSEEITEQDLSKRIVECNKKFYDNFSREDLSKGKMKFPRAEFMKYQQQVISPKINVGVDYIFSGAEALAYSKPNIFKNDLIYPLKKIEFENEEFWAPANPKKYLEWIYGNIYEFPQFKVFGHSNIVNNFIEDYKIAYKELKSIFQSFTPNDDTEYWNNYYSEELPTIEKNSLFAEYIFNKYISTGDIILELGCGNGRDSVYFANNGLDVFAIDSSGLIIKKLMEKFQSNEKLKFVCGDFVELLCLDIDKVDVIYSRFTLHSITAEQQSKLLKESWKMLYNGGLLCIEVRGINDTIYGLGDCVGRDEYIYNGHYRRFLRMDELISELKKVGFQIIEANEKSGFAPFGNDDPKVIRVVAQK